MRGLVFCSLAVVGSGCTFFGNSYDECFDDPSSVACTMSMGGSVGDGKDPLDPGGGMAGGSVGFASGGSSTGGGDDGSGGSTGGGGTVTTGGSSGTGGSTVTGGSGGTGGTGTVPRLFINELAAYTYIELLSHEASSTSLDDISLALGGMVSPGGERCALSGGNIEGNGYFLIAITEKCDEAMSCDATCTFSLSPGGYVHLMKGADIIASAVVESTTPSTSYGAYPEGSDNYCEMSRTPRAANGLCW